MPKDKFAKYALYLLGIVILFSLSFFRAFEIYELQTLDLRFKLRPPLKVDPNVVIIEISEDSIKEFGRWPFSRHYHAYLIDCLRQLGVRAIVFDILFGEESPEDADLIEITKKAGELVYYPFVLGYDDKKINKGIPQAKNMEVPLIDGLLNAARGAGFINAVADADGKIRRVPLFMELSGKRYSQLAYLAAIDCLEGAPASTTLASVKDIPVDDEGMVLVNYPGRWKETFKHYSFADILISFRDTVEGRQARINLSDLYDKVCFVGQTEAGGHDIKANPLEPAYPMVGVHASLFNSIAQNKFLVRADKFLNLLLLLGLCISVAVVAAKAKRPFAGLGISAGIILVFVIAGFLLFILFGLWIDLFCPIVITAGVYVVFTVHRYLVEKRGRLLIDKELSIAKDIQMDFLPSSVPQRDDLEVAVSIEPAKAVGGDLYDFVTFDTASAAGQKRLGIMIGDVSGKGVPAALFMARAIGDFRHFVVSAVRPSGVLSELNRQIALNYKANLFVTMFYIIYDDTKKALVFSNAGHLPAIWLKASGEIEFLKTEGMPLGLMDSAEYSDSSVNLNFADTLVLYTDGVTEARNAKHEEFGEDRLKAVVFEARGLSSASMVEAIKKRLSKFVGSQPQHDDCTILVLKVKPQA